MKRKPLHDAMLEDGTVHYGQHSDGRWFENGKPVTAAKPPVETKPTADVVMRPAPKINAAPRITDSPKRKIPPEVTGLQRAIFANILAQGGELPSSEPKNESVTGLQRAINANIAASKKKS